MLDPSHHTCYTKVVRKQFLITSPRLAVMVFGGHEAEKVASDLAHRFKSYFQCNVVGSVYFNSATPPCFVCGYGTTCRYGGPARWLAPDTFENFKITPEMFQRFEDHPEVVAAYETLSNKFKTAIVSLPEP